MALERWLAREQVRVGWRTAVDPDWGFDLDAIRAAVRELGLREPVQVGCAEYANGRWSGMYSHDADEGHRVRIGRRLSAEQASRTLWHELAHAAQRERGSTGGTRHLARRDRAAYESDWREVDARAHEANHDRLPLTRP